MDATDGRFDVHWLVRIKADNPLREPQATRPVGICTMGAPEAASAYELGPAMDLEPFFLHFLERFESLSIPRSVAEARITSREAEALSQWLFGHWQWFGFWCESAAQIEVADEISASRQEMFGALLLILASEICRGTSNEEAVWPAVTAHLGAGPTDFSALFVRGQPTTACKRAMIAGARRLNLRNLIDRYGVLEYFETIKLQFGFTRHGAVRRLPEWLDSCGTPVAVQILIGESEYGDLKAASFSKLWKTLQDFRRKRVAEEYASAILHASPWIRPEWADELLQLAKLRSNRILRAPTIHEDIDRSNEPTCELVFTWVDASKPRLALRLNDEMIRELLGEAEEAEFVVDGRVIGRWYLQESGEWYGKRELPYQPEGAKANLPRMLSINSAGKVLEEVDLWELGLREPVLIFDLRSGSTIALSARLDPSRDYALICDEDLTIPGRPPSFKLKHRSVYRLSAPWSRDLRIVCDGVLYWQPRIEEREPLRVIRLALESLPGEIVEL
ncbi:MAG: hypothetical protein KIT09_18305 [Bryobacteraceae bacterium]|nr:hypothetical protein [Bryobacteraceae bacterium]